jgi:hypothetical protein
VASLSLALICALAAKSPVKGDEFKDLLKILERSATERVENLVEEGRRAVETTASVARVDYSVRPSFVIRTTDGRIFQTKSVSLAAAANLSVQLGAAARVDFSRRGGLDYEVSFTFPRVEASSDGMAASILADAANGWLGMKEISRVQTQIRAVFGTALDGSDWVLDLDGSALLSIELLDAEGPPAPAPRQHPTPARLVEAPLALLPSATAAPPSSTLPSATSPMSMGSNPMLVTGPAATPSAATVAAAEAIPSRVKVPARPEVSVPRSVGRLQRLEGSFGSFSVDTSPRPYVGEVVRIERNGELIAHAQVLDRSAVLAHLEVLESLAADTPRPGDLIFLGD